MRLLCSVNQGGQELLDPNLLIWLSDGSKRSVVHWILELASVGSQIRLGDMGFDLKVKCFATKGLVQKFYLGRRNSEQIPNNAKLKRKKVEYRRSKSKEANSLKWFINC